MITIHVPHNSITKQGNCCLLVSECTCSLLFMVHLLTYVNKPSVIPLTI